MIITCERCATRFKVPDDKLAAGAVRMRCSKCNHVFLAGPAAVVAEGAAPPAMTLPPSQAATLPPSSLPPQMSPFGAPRVPSVPAPVSGAVPVFGAPRLPSKDPFANLGPSLSAPPPFAAPAPLVPQPISAPVPFAPPSPLPPSSSRALPDPFANLGAPSSTPRPAGDAFGTRPDPFAASSSSMRPPSDPFAPQATPMRPPTDPFAPAPTPLRPPTDPFGPRPVTDPFAGLAAPTTPVRAPTADPFAGLPSSSTAPTTAPDPFGVSTSRPPAPVGMADPFASATPSRPPTPVGMGDPFATPAPPSTSRPDPFASFGPAPGAPVPVDPFALSSPPAAADPFAAAMSSSSTAPLDPFAAVTAPPRSSFDDVDPFAAPRQPTPPPPPPHEEEDPFGRLDDVNIGGPSGAPNYDAEARASLFGMTAPTPPTSANSSFGPVPTNAPSGLELAAPSSTTLPSPSLSTTTRALPVLRAALAVLEVLVFIVLVVVAIVVGRGGSPAALLGGDVVGSLSPDSAGAGPLRVDDVDVAWRTSTSGTALLVVTGTVHHGGDAPFAAVLVDVVAGEDVIASGYAWSDVDGFAIAEITSANDITDLQLRQPKAPRVSPGDDASFVVVAAAPAAEAPIRVVARAAP